MEVSEVSLNGCLNSAADKLQIDDFRPEQRTALQYFLQGHDVFVNLPTGFGKSAIFQAAPYCCEFLRQLGLQQARQGGGANVDESSFCIALVISPLTALMKDQLDSLSRKGIKATALTKDTPTTTRQSIKKGEFSIVFASPEAILASGRAILCSDIYTRNLCGIFVDESHCVKKWGFADGKTKAFRKEYANLGELRSMAGCRVPLVALTATATATTRATIMTSLAMINPFIVSKPPQRENIKYVVIRVQEKNVFETFKWKLEELQKKGAEAERPRFESQLLPSSAEDRLFAKFHAQTDDDVKQMVMESFQDASSNLRVLFATVAFGMGIDMTALHTVVHYGPPHDVEEFVQESGRAGRDGQQSTSVLICYPGAGKFTRPNESMKAVMNTNSCRRQEVLSNFDDAIDGCGTIIKHLCCDVCAALCTCGEAACKERCLAERSLQRLTEAGTVPTARRIISSEQKSVLQEHLQAFRSGLTPEATQEQHFLAGGDITSGFPSSTALQIVQECHMVFTFDEFTSRYALYSKDVQENVFGIVQDTLKDCAVVNTSPDPSDTSDTDLSSSSTSTSQVVRPQLVSSSTDSEHD